MEELERGLKRERSNLNTDWNDGWKDYNTESLMLQKISFSLSAIVIDIL